jgi:hypothetical protein
VRRVQDAAPAGCCQEDLVSWAWISDDEPPDAWTPERAQKAELVACMRGDLERAAEAWQEYARLQFARFLVTSGRIGEANRGR